MTEAERVLGGVERAFSKAFVDQLLSRLTTATAAGANAEGTLEMGELVGTLIDRSSDLRVGNGFAQAYVHGPYLNANRSRLQMFANPICG